MYRNALQTYKGQALTNAGRALTKHPEVVSLTKNTIRQSLRTDHAINEVAQQALKNIMRSGVRTIENLPRFGKVVQYKLPGGHGARFGADSGNFIGFINP